MADRLQRLLLRAHGAGPAAALLLAAGLTAAIPGFAADAADGGGDWMKSEPLDPLEQQRREIDLDEINTEDFEIGVYGGALAVEDFGVDLVRGISAAYRVTEDIYLEGVYFQGELGETSFERLSGGAPLLTDDERELTHYGINLGIDLLPGESYIGPWTTINSTVYFVGGVGSTEFGGDDRFTITAGMGYRLFATDWISMHFDVRDHFFDSDLLGEKRTIHNFEFRSGLTVFF